MNDEQIKNKISDAIIKTRGPEPEEKIRFLEALFNFKSENKKSSYKNLLSELYSDEIMDAKIYRSIADKKEDLLRRMRIDINERLLESEELRCKAFIHLHRGVFQIIVDPIKISEKRRKELNIKLKRTINESDRDKIKRYLIFYGDELKYNNSLSSKYSFLMSAHKKLDIHSQEPEFKEPHFFRKNGPIAADIVGRKVFERNEVDDIDNALKNFDAVLLQGIAATGKTVIARILAYQWNKSGKNVRFLELKNESIKLDQLLSEMRNLSSNNPIDLLIIEDLHLNPKLINSFLHRWSSGPPKLLITSRSTDFEILGNEINRINFLPRINLEPFDPADKLIEIYFKSNEKKGWQLNDNLVNDIIKYSQNSLWVLSYALKSLDETKGRKIYEDSVIGEVKKDLENLSHIESQVPIITRKLYIPILLTFSILYRYEIKTDGRFLTEWISSQSDFETEVALDELVKMGEVFKTENGLYGLPHSSLANLYYQFGKYFPEYSQYLEDERFTLEYVASNKAQNGLRLFHESDPSPYHKCIIDLICHSFCLEFNIKNMAEAINNAHYLNDSVLSIAYIFSKCPEKGDKVWGLINKIKLSKRINQLGEDLPYIFYFISIIFGVDETAGNELWSPINKKMIADHLIQNQDIEQSVLIIWYIYKINEKIGDDVWRRIDKEILIYKILNSQELLDRHKLEDKICQAYDLDFAADLKQIYKDSPTAGKELLQIIKNIGTDGWNWYNIMGITSQSIEKMPYIPMKMRHLTIEKLV
jgi:hypothetical protein